MRNLVLARHIVGVSVVALALPTLIWGRFTFADWLTVVFAIVLFAGAATGLVALFFTQTQAARSAETFVLLIWALTGLVTLGTSNGQRLLALITGERSIPSASAQREPAGPFDDLVPKRSESQQQFSNDRRQGETLKGFFDDTQKCDPTNPFMDAVPACREHASPRK